MLGSVTELNPLHWQRRKPAAWCRLIPSIIGLFTFGFFSWLFGTHAAWYHAALQLIDGIPNPHPFGDLRAILLAGYCWRTGVDVYVHSGCMMGGVFNYSPFLLRAVYLGLGPQQTAIGGILLGLLFFLSLAWLAPPQTNTVLVLRSLAAISPAVVYGLESANLDIAIFMLVLGGVRLINMQKTWSVLGYAIFGFAAALKFYPLALMALALREPLKRLCAIAIASCAAMATFLFYYAGGTAAAIRILPGNLPFSGAFGALNIPFGIGLLLTIPARTLNPTYAQYTGVLQNYPSLPTFIYIGTHALWILAIVATLAIRRRYENSLAPLSSATKNSLIAGVIVIVFCFFAAQNFGYRAVFLMLALPGLCDLAGSEASPGRFCGLTISVFFLLWESLPRMLINDLAVWFPGFTVSYVLGVGFWVLRELLWWWVIIQFSALLLDFLSTQIRRLTAIDHTRNTSLSSENVLR